MESNLGYLEYELCKFFNVTPKGLGSLREKDPNGVAFVEAHMIHRWNVESREYDKQKRESEAEQNRTFGSSR